MTADCTCWPTGIDTCPVHSQIATALPVDPGDTCVVCGLPIRTMIFRGTGVCGRLCRKAQAVAMAVAKDRRRL